MIRLICFNAVSRLSIQSSCTLQYSFKASDWTILAVITRLPSTHFLLTSTLNLHSRLIKARILSNSVSRFLLNSWLTSRVILSVVIHNAFTSLRSHNINRSISARRKLMLETKSHDSLSLITSLILLIVRRLTGNLVGEVLSLEASSRKIVPRHSANWETIIWSPTYPQLAIKKLSW